MGQYAYYNLSYLGLNDIDLSGIKFHNKYVYQIFNIN